MPTQFLHPTESSKMKKLLYLLTLSSVFFIGCKDDALVVQPSPVTPNCEQVDCVPTAEFYGMGLMNGNCWQATWAIIDSLASPYLAIILSGGESNGIGELLYITVNNVTNLRDTIWLGGAYSNQVIPNLANTWYSYTEDHSIAGSFSFKPTDALTYKDFLLIDYFNADTTIVEGRFQVRFPHRSINNFVTHAPDSMRIECGRFRAQAQ
jgi:hypothetical protein